MSDQVEFVTRFVTRGLSKVQADTRRLTGYAIVFNGLSQDLGGFKERIAPSAVDRTLRKGQNVDALLDHRRESTAILGSTDSGLLRLRRRTVRARGGHHASGHDQRQRRAGERRRGSCKGMSFAFRTMPQGETWDEEDGQLVRTVTDMEFSEVSVVLNPAYLQTEISARNAKVDRPSWMPSWRRSVEALAGVP
jgi:HK97 family phage prohead protease